MPKISKEEKTLCLYLTDEQVTMRYLSLFFLFYSQLVNAQFELSVLQYDEIEYIGNPHVDVFIEGENYRILESKMMVLKSDEKPEVAERINNHIFTELFGTPYTEMVVFDSLFPAYKDYSQIQLFDYEIIENSARYFTVKVSYLKKYESVRSHRHFTFASINGQILEMAQILEMSLLDSVAKLLYPVFAKDLNDYITQYEQSENPSEDQLYELKLCAENYFLQSYRIEYGIVYLTSAGIHFENPFCPDRSVVLTRRELFTASFTYAEFKDVLQDYIYVYSQTGVFE